MENSYSERKSRSKICSSTLGRNRKLIAGSLLDDLVSPLSVVLNSVLMMDTSISYWPGYDTSYYAVPKHHNSVSSARSISCLINCTNDIVQCLTLSDRRLGSSNVQPKTNSYKNSLILSQDTICNMSSYEYLWQTVMKVLQWKQHDFAYVPVLVKLAFS